MSNIKSILLLTFFPLVACQNLDENIQVKTIDIFPEQVDCIGVAPMKCFKIKETGKQDWELLYQPIENFEFKNGYYYKIQVKIEPKKNIPADGSSETWRLIKIISETKA